MIQHLKMLSASIIRLNMPLSSIAFNTVQSQIRLISYKQSKPVGDPSEYTDYEIVHNPKEWKYVERLMPMKWIPEVTPKESYPSGWAPQKVTPNQLPYFVERSKNYMLPVYLKIRMRGVQRITKVRNVEGDIWKLSRELHQYLLKVTGNTSVGAKVDEMKRTIFFRGDYVEYIKKYLTDKGL